MVLLIEQMQLDVLLESDDCKEILHVNREPLMNGMMKEHEEWVVCVARVR